MNALPFRAVVIGASSGGVQALMQILSVLPRSFPLPIMVVQHIPERSPEAFVSVFQHVSKLKVLEAEDKGMPEAGHVYLAPPGYHLLVEHDGSLSLNVDEAVNYSRPSIDVLFESAASAFGPDVLAVLLTGSNHDGAAGVAHIKRLGGTVVIEDPATADSPAMPQAALARVKPNYLLNLDQIGPFLSGFIIEAKKV